MAQTIDGGFGLEAGGGIIETIKGLFNELLKYQK